MAIVYETLELTDEIEGLDDDFNVTVKVVGVGGGGGNALEYMAKRGIEGVEYIAVNTDVPALKQKDHKLMKRMQIGKKLTKGRGAGGRPEVGCDSAHENRDDIERALDGTAMVFVSAGMGGGTGTGAAPVIAEIAKSMGILTVGVVTKPFDFERVQKMNAAVKGIEEMRKYVDALIIIPNQKLLSSNEQGVKMKEAFEKVDNVLYKVVRSISEVLNKTSYMNLDFSDMETVMKDSGDAHIAIAEASGDDKVKEAVAQIVNCPLLETSINNAGKMLIHVTMSEEGTSDELDDLVNALTQAAHPDVHVITGCEISTELKDTIIVTAVATSFLEDHGLPLSRDKRQNQQRFKSEPIDKGVTMQLKEDREQMRDNNSNGGLGTLITQSLENDSGMDYDPYEQLEEIFNRK